MGERATIQGDPRWVKLKNEHLDKIRSDHLYHLGIQVENTCEPRDIIAKYGDVRFFLMGGTKQRMNALAKLLRKLDLPGDNKEDLEDLAQKGKRYSMYKVGPVLCCSHGMGAPSMSILMHELLKLAKYARCLNPIFIRMGTSGGLGVVPGTVVVTDRVFNGHLKREHEMFILGERVIRPTYLDTALAKEILRCANWNDAFLTIRANTLTTDCFYEGQGRLDGANCEYTEEEKLRFLEKCHTDFGICNIEMESSFAALTNHLGVRAANVCVCVVNRLNGDQVKLEAAKMAQFERNLMIVVARFVHCTLLNIKVDAKMPPR